MTENGGSYEGEMEYRSKKRKKNENGGITRNSFIYF